MLVPQPLEDPLRRVPLLAVDLPVALEDLLDDRQEPVELRLPLLRQPVARRLHVRQDLRQRVPVDPVLGTGRPLADLAPEDPAANLAPHLHVGVHPRPPPLATDRSERPNSLTRCR